MKVMALNGILGYGYPLASLEKGLALKPDVVGTDGGSTDPGPYYLGAGVSFTSRAGVKRDLALSMPRVLKQKIPFIIGTAGGSGGEPHLKWCREIVEEIARENDLHFKMALIHAEFPKAYVRKKLREGKIRPMGPNLTLTEEDIAETVRFVGQMGSEPFIKALNTGSEVILAGRSSDPAIYAALPLAHGQDAGLVWHASKIIECGALCAVPGTTGDCIMAHLERDYFLLEPLSPIRRCTPLSVAGHTLYEQPNPYHLYEPDGMMDLSQCQYDAYTDSIARVSGSKWVPARQPTIKIEGSARYGYRTISIAGCRDPLMIEAMDEVTDHVRRTTSENYSGIIDPKDYTILFRLYGKNGVEGDWEPQKKTTSQELGVVIEVVAKTQEIANDICAVARSTMLHYHYTGRKATAGNLAFPYSPSDIAMGPAYRFSAYHLVELEDAAEPFEIETVMI